MPVEKMGVDVEEVMLRTMFGVAQVKRSPYFPARTSPFSEHARVHTWQYGAGDMGKCGLVSKAWTKEFKKWVAGEEKRVTEVMWERAARDGVELCCSMKKDVSEVGYLLVFEKREVVDVLFKRIGPWSTKYLGTHVKNATGAGAKMMTVPDVVWSSERKWARQEDMVPPVEMDEALAEEREVVEGWETATVAEVVAWVRATAALL
jgi:hypothetical protein